MKIQVKYFGMLKEFTSCSEDFIQLKPTDVSVVADVLEIILQKHPQLKGKSFRIAYDQQIVNKEETITSMKELALLPPFSGG